MFSVKFMCKTTHDLLLMILLDETGAQGEEPRQPIELFQHIQMAFEGIKTHLTEDSWSEASLEMVPGVKIDKIEDMRLFLKLYRGIHSVTGVFGCADESSILRQCVYPLIAETVNKNGVLQDQLSQMFFEAGERSDAAVEDRILRRFDQIGVQLDRDPVAFATRSPLT